MDFVAETMRDPGGYLSREQIEKIINAGETDRDRLLLKLLWDTGCRISELVPDKKSGSPGLLVKNIKRSEKCLILPNLKRRGESLSWKRVSITANGAEMLDEYLKKNYDKIGESVFNISRFQAFRIVRNAGKKAGIEYCGMKKLHPHHFRHSFSINWIKSGGDLRKLQMLLGHSSISTTGYYLRFSTDEVEKDYHRIMG